MHKKVTTTVQKLGQVSFRIWRVPWLWNDEWSLILWDMLPHFLIAFVPGKAKKNQAQQYMPKKYAIEKYYSSTTLSTKRAGHTNPNL